MPAFFADRRLSVLAIYDGAAPWTGGNVTFVMPGGVNEVGALHGIARRTGAGGTWY